MGYATLYPAAVYEVGSPIEGDLTVDSVAGDHIFNDAKITLPSWVDVKKVSHAYLDFYVCYIRNTNAAYNTIDGDQNITVDINGGGYLYTGVTLTDNSLAAWTTETRTGLRRVVGTTDLKSYLVNGCTLTMKWVGSKATLNTLYFGDMWFILRIYMEG